MLGAACVRTNKGKGRVESGGGSGASLALPKLPGHSHGAFPGLPRSSRMFSEERAALPSCESFLFVCAGIKRLPGTVQFLGHVKHQHT